MAAFGWTDDTHDQTSHDYSTARDIAAAMATLDQLYDDLDTEFGEDVYEPGLINARRVA